MPAPILTRRKPVKCERARIALFLGLFCIVGEDDKEIGASFGSPGGGVRDWVDGERFSSAMVAMDEGEGEGEGTKKTFNEFFNELARLKENLDVGNTLPVSAECQESANLP